MTDPFAPDQMADLIERLERAAAALDGLVAVAVGQRHDTEEIRLRGKREGVQLALSYALEEQRRG